MNFLKGLQPELGGHKCFVSTVQTSSAYKCLMTIEVVQDQRVTLVLSWYNPNLANSGSIAIVDLTDNIFKDHFEKGVNMLVEDGAKAYGKLFARAIKEQSYLELIADAMYVNLKVSYKVGSTSLLGRLKVSARYTVA